MDVILRIPDRDDVESLPSLHAWLLDDAELRRGVRIGRTAAAPGDGTMGGDLELISLLVGSAFNLANIAVTIAGWRAAQPAPQVLRIEVNGVPVDLPDGGAVTVARLTRALEATAEPAAEPAPPVAQTPTVQAPTVQPPVAQPPAPAPPVGGDG